jgi:hypothetical protein
LQSVHELNISSPKGKPAHQKALEKFIDEGILLTQRSEKHREQLDAYIQEIKSSGDFPHVDWDSCFGVCNHSVLKKIFPVPLNLALAHDQYAIRHHTFYCLPVSFQRFFRRFRNIAVMLELVHHADSTRYLLSFSEFSLSPSENSDRLQKPTPRDRSETVKRNPDERKELEIKVAFAYYSKILDGVKVKKGEFALAHGLEKTAMSKADFLDGRLKEFQENLEYATQLYDGINKILTCPIENGQ